jgi:hypothetical protein
VARPDGVGFPLPISSRSVPRMKSFIQELRRGGYLLTLDDGGPAKPAIYKLRPAMNTGPLPPMILTAKIVYDQNRSQIMGEAVAEEAQP